MKKKSIIIIAIGLLIMLSLLFEACKKDDDNFAPTASFTVTPNSGNTETLFFLMLLLVLTRKILSANYKSDGILMEMATGIAIG